jgi:hypothetical protein
LRQPLFCQSHVAEKVYFNRQEKGFKYLTQSKLEELVKDQKLFFHLQINFLANCLPMQINL